MNSAPSSRSGLHSGSTPSSNSSRMFSVPNLYSHSAQEETAQNSYLAQEVIVHNPTLVQKEMANLFRRSSEQTGKNPRPSMTPHSEKRDFSANPRPLGNFGQCEECKGSRSGYNWCQYCNSEHFKNNFENWSSGNKELDSFIQVAQLNAVNARSVLEWIEYQEFKNVKHLADGGNSSVFMAHWPQRPIQAWDTTANNWERGWQQMNSDVVILKRIKNSNNVSNFLNELSAYHQFSKLVTHVVRCYGISRCPSTSELIVVTSYARDGDLRKYLSNNFDTFTWQQKLITLKDIAGGLVTIHKAGLLHKDLHTGNILRDGSWTLISDLGLCWNNTSAIKSDGIVRGVLPYVAPEVLRGRPYTRAADVYSIGMIMYELWSGRRPFEGIDYDMSLVVEICSGTRPEITSDIPDYYSLIMKACWDGNPDLRPTSRDLERTFNAWIESIANRQLALPNPTTKKAESSKTKNDDSAPISTSGSSSTCSMYISTPSQPLPFLSVAQHKLLEEQDERYDALYRKYLEHAEQESQNKDEEPINPLTWTHELKILADDIFASIASKSMVPMSDSIGMTNDNPTENSDEIQDSKTKQKKPLHMQFLTKLLILLHIGKSNRKNFKLYT